MPTFDRLYGKVETIIREKIIEPYEVDIDDDELDAAIVLLLAEFGYEEDEESDEVE